MEKSEYSLKIRAFRSVNDPEACATYLNGHMQVLIDYNVMKVTSYNKSWMRNPSAYVLVAERTDTGEMVGGIRVEVAKGLFPLPIQSAVGHMDPKVHELVRYYAQHGGVGELCGLWNSKSVKGVGVSYFLTRSAISIVNQLRFITMVGICAEYTLKMFTDVGFEINPSVGKNGEFPYPDDRYITRALGILNAQTLHSAAPLDKEIMLSLRHQPVQLREEQGTRGSIMVDYNLIVTDVDTLNYSEQ